MAERVQIEAALRSEVGFQRLTRVGPNQLSQVSLVPRETMSLVHSVCVAWRDGAFGLEVGPNVAYGVRPGGGDVRPQGVISVRGEDAAEGRHVLAPGDRFLLGATELELECTTRRWPVDLERERALLARDDAAAWSIYMDELLANGDPLGFTLAKTREFDIGFTLEVSPLIATGEVAFAADERGLWRELSFQRAPQGGADDEFDEFDEAYAAPIVASVFEAVLTQPIAWFTRRVTVAFDPNEDEYGESLVTRARAAAALVSCFAGPHLEVLSLPGFPASEALPAVRDGVRVER